MNQWRKKRYKKFFAHYVWGGPPLQKCCRDKTKCIHAVWIPVGEMAYEVKCLKRTVHYSFRTKKEVFAVIRIADGNGILVEQYYADSDYDSKEGFIRVFNTEKGIKENLKGWEKFNFEVLKNFFTEGKKKGDTERGNRAVNVGICGTPANTAEYEQTKMRKNHCYRSPL
mmetsp:Transcript_54814/g.133125  ORF Transcript_54814/g.133125 Transcript_54814/m.133125 type:complete len:169 (-) Transcript_54814:2042-2548(-)